ncbi:amino acid ABC transporter substrate-binding protein (PAAT family) [Actinocorallia herbida]|uniref:Amino acid ABC transporter substrate-binding protein (PAAT family) n=1 Tax=Actinocorallia herbida TaxID=58109 RepID=A0A3N1CX41_9ACTN|nr:ABC transporter substrate-binding protein [Actinocorallia herbida]ROO85870.1 amino acid ABC transporter substrate-binding protein (PAAT family) [Actinocorallia herbida]
MLRRLTVLPVLAVLVAAAACAPADDTTAAAPSASGTAACAKESLPLKTAGTLTIGTDKPAYEPWFSDDDPTNGKGFESAVAYAVAEKLGFAETEVKWETVGFDSSYAPGPKTFDFDINQVSISEARAKAVTFSAGYYDVAQAVVGLEDGKFASATGVAALKDAKIGVQVGTTSLTAVQDQIKPGTQPQVFNNQIDAVNALKNKQVDAIVVDLPTAFYVTAAQIEGSKIIGQLPAAGGTPERFGLVLEKGSALVGCLDQALGELRSSGDLAKIQDQWLAAAAGAPVLR